MTMKDKPKKEFRNFPLCRSTALRETERKDVIGASNDFSLPIWYEIRDNPTLPFLPGRKLPSIT